MYILSYKLALFCGAGVDAMQNLGGGISPEMQQTYTLSYKLPLFYGSKVKVRHNLRGGISTEKPKMYI